MITRMLLIALTLLGAFEAPELGVVSARRMATTVRSALASTGSSTTCNACRMHEEIKEMSLKAIKENILNRLGLKQAPNMTGRALPRIPPINKLMDMYGMQADQPLEPGVSYHEEVDEFVAKTESVFAFAQPRKSFYFHLMFFICKREVY